MSQGKIVQIIGAVVDVEFPRAEVPKVYDALTEQATEMGGVLEEDVGDALVRNSAPSSRRAL